MKKNYNRDVTSDMPIDSSFTPPVEDKTIKKTTKPKINAIGTQKRGSASKKTPAKTPAKTTAKTTAKKSTTVKTKEDKAKELSDLEKLNEENIKTYRFKSKRNRFLITLLSVLLAISIAIIVSYIVIIKLKANCNMHIHGDVEAHFIVNDIEMDEFRAPSNMQGNRIFQLEIEVDIESSGEYIIWFEPKAYQNGKLMENTLIYEHNNNLFYDNGDGTYHSIAPIKGNQTILLCGGVILDYEYEDSLNIDNFKLDFHVYFEKV